MFLNVDFQCSRNVFILFIIYLYVFLYYYYEVTSIFLSYSRNHSTVMDIQNVKYFFSFLAKLAFYFVGLIAHACILYSFIRGFVIVTVKIKIKVDASNP